jgi:hypothetical protein
VKPICAHPVAAHHARARPFVVFSCCWALLLRLADAPRRAPQVGYTITPTRSNDCIGCTSSHQGDVVTHPPTPTTPRDHLCGRIGEVVGSVATNLQRHCLVADAEIFRRVVQYEGAERRHSCRGLYPAAQHDDAEITTSCNTGACRRLQ